jgi:hypothetical protein
MTAHDLERDLKDSLGKDQLESVAVRIQVPRGVWVKILRAMKAKNFSQASDYLANLVREQPEVTEPEK